MRYKFGTKVRNVYPQMTRVYKSGTGPDAVFADEPTGKWIISLEGVGAFVMPEKPEFKSGDSVTLILEGPDA